MIFLKFWFFQGAKIGNDLNNFCNAEFMRRMLKCQAIIFFMFYKIQ